MGIEKLSGRLRKFGFTKEEAEIYIFLSSMGPSPARLVTRRFDINRMKAYRLLKSLEEKGFVERIMGRPMKFAAAPIGETLNGYINDIKSSLSDLENMKGGILEEWERITKGSEDRFMEPRFRIYQGRQQVYDLITQMYERVAREIWILTTRNDLRRLSLMGIDEQLKAIADREVNVRILTTVDEPESEEFTYLLDFAEVRHAPLQAPVRFVTIDNNETLTTTSMDDSMSITTQEDTGLWTNAPSYNSAMKIFFNALWRLALDAHEIIEALKSGTTPQEIRVIRAQNDYLGTFRRMLKTCESSLQLMVSTVDDLPLPIEYILNNLNKKSKIKILTQLDLDNLQKLNDVIEATEVMHSPSPFDLHLLMIDNKEVLMNFPSTPSMDRAVWSNMEVFIETMNNIFMDYWNRGELVEDITKRLTIQKKYLEKSNAIKSIIELLGWQVESPGSLAGSSGVEHSFNIVATNLNHPEVTLAIDILQEETAFNHIIRLGAKSIDLKPRKILLASTKPFQVQEVNLAKLYNIDLVFDEE
ncbi:MAG: helix-turn-helix domain-containing protein, partial [Candidatus Bathyarchaeota archaeon]